MERSRPCLHEKAILQTQNESPSGRRKIIRLCIYPAGRDSTFGGIPKEGRCPKYHRTDSYHRLLGWLGHRQISPSPSYLRDMTFRACGASSVFVSCSSMLQTPEACPLRKPALVVPSVTTLRMATHLRFISRDSILDAKRGITNSLSLYYIYLAQDESIYFSLI